MTLNKRGSLLPNIFYALQATVCSYKKGPRAPLCDQQFFIIEGVTCLEGEAVTISNFPEWSLFQIVFTSVKWYLGQEVPHQFTKYTLDILMDSNFFCLTQVEEENVLSLIHLLTDRRFFLSLL